MKTTIISTIMATALILAGTFSTSAQWQRGTAQSAVSGVFVNDQELSNDILTQLQQVSGTRIPKGRYWYDANCGAWGMAGGPTLGFTYAGLNLGGALKATASNGRTKVFINGRELPIQDVAALNNLISPYRVIPGRFYLDQNGNVGYENGQYLGNLVQIAQSKSGSSGGRSRVSGMYDSGIGAVNGGGFISGSSSVTHP